MRIAVVLALAGAASLSSADARAEVASSSPSAFMVRGEQATAAAPAAVARAIGAVGKWWSPAHTYSGDASRLKMDIRAGGCFCELWSTGQSVEHGRVVLVMEHEGVRTIRIDGALGPLQELGAHGVLTFTISGAEAGAKIGMMYRVAGDPSLGLDQIAPLVDQVLNEQLTRLALYTATGKPTP